jgi:hypothetical protein
VVLCSGTVVRGLRCGIVLVETMSVKSASRPFGIEQVRLLTLTASTSEERSYADPAERYEPEGHLGKPAVSRADDGKAGRVPG